MSVVSHAPICDEKTSPVRRRGIVSLEERFVEIITTLRNRLVDRIASLGAELLVPLLRLELQQAPHARSFHHTTQFGLLSGCTCFVGIILIDHHARLEAAVRRGLDRPVPAGA